MLALLGRKGGEEEAIIEGVNGGNTAEACGESKVKLFLARTPSSFKHHEVKAHWRETLAYPNATRVPTYHLTAPTKTVWLQFCSSRLGSDSLPHSRYCGIFSGKDRCSSGSGGIQAPRRSSGFVIGPFL